MGKKVKEKKDGFLKISLFDPGMTTLHKAGLAGLWMTLEAIENDTNFKIRVGRFGSWKRDETSVSLSWNDEEAFFKELFDVSFGMSQEGFFSFPALGDPDQHPQHAVVLQEAVLGTVLQHGRTRKADKSNDPRGNLTIAIDDISTMLRYHKIFSYAHRKPDDFQPGAMNRLVGWLYPGGGSRHMGLGKNTDLDNPPGLALALRYLIVGAIYFEIHRRGGGVRPRYAMVIPEIDNLRIYAGARRVFLEHGVQRLTAAGTAEAGLRVLAELNARHLVEDLAVSGCRVFSFGTVPWSSQQKTRVEIFEVRVERRHDLRPFQVARQVFEVKLIRPEKGDPFWDVPQAPELIARNVVEGRPWWQGFADFIADKDVREHIFNYEKGGLAKMIQGKDVFPESSERVFIEACHEAWRRRMGQLGERAGKEGISFHDLVSREFERLRVGFSRSKNAATIRAAVTDFWARSGGSLASLQGGWREVLALFDEQNWQKARDLALLALASYKPANREEERVLLGTGREKEGGENG